MNISSHRDLVVWHKAMSLAEQVYRLTSAFPRHELYGLTSHMTRAAVSVPATISEGYYRSTREYLHFLSIAKGSVIKVETLLLIAVRLNYLREADVQPVCDLVVEISKMLTAIHTKLSG